MKGSRGSREFGLAFLFFFVPLMILVSGCKSTLSSSTNPVDTAPPPAETPVGVVNEGSFYVQPVVAKTVSTFFHEQSDLSKICEVKVGETDLTKKDIFCILDMQELDLYHQSLDLNFNSPSTMCPYVRITPYWFYDYEPPHGKINQTATITKDVSGATITYGGTEGSQTIDNTYHPVSVDSTGAVSSCRYDYTLGEGPNCCEGTLSVTITDNTATPPAVTQSTNALGGEITNCINGPGKDFLVNDKNYPIPQDIPTALSGVNDKLTLLAPASLNRSGNLYRANYFKPTDYTGNVTDEFSSSVVAPLAVRGPASIPRSGTPYYHFACVDSAGDYIARIRVLIRSWDTMVDFTAKNNPYNSGSETNFPDQYWHDKLIWKDLFDGSGAEVYPDHR